MKRMIYVILGITIIIVGILFGRALILYTPEEYQSDFESITTPEQRDSMKAEWAKPKYFNVVRGYEKIISYEHISIPTDTMGDKPIPIGFKVKIYAAPRADSYVENPYNIKLDGSFTIYIRGNQTSLQRLFPYWLEKIGPNHWWLYEDLNGYLSALYQEEELQVGRSNQQYINPEIVKAIDERIADYKKDHPNYKPTF